MPIKLTDITDYVGITNTKQNEPELPKKPAFDLEKEGARQVLYEWDAVNVISTSKPSAKMSRTFVVIGVVVALLLVLMQQFLLIALVASVVFLYHVLSSVSAETVHHKLTNHGVDYAGSFYTWGELQRFYFKTQEGSSILCIDTKERIPGRLFLILRTGDEQKVKEITSRYISYLEEEPKTFADKIYDSAAKRVVVEE